MNPETLESFHRYTSGRYGTRPEVLASEGEFFLTTAVAPLYGDLSITFYQGYGMWWTYTVPFGETWEP